MDFFSFLFQIFFRLWADVREAQYIDDEFGRIHTRAHTHVERTDSCSGRRHTYTLGCFACTNTRAHLCTKPVIAVSHKLTEISQPLKQFLSFILNKCVTSNQLEAELPSAAAAAAAKSRDQLRRARVQKSLNEFQEA